jgi:hypothetical protein
MKMMFVPGVELVGEQHQGGALTIEIEIVYNNTSKNRLLSLGPPFCYAQPVVGLLSVR